jgi:flagellar hook-associated protein 2
VAQSTIVAGVNDMLSVSISGTTASVKLAAGSYTASALAAQVQAAINGTTAFSTAGIAVTASSSANVLKVTSTRYGATSGINITGGTAYASLFSGAATSVAGIDVAGTVNGKAATGVGQILTGAKGDASEGIQVQVAGGATGARGSVNFSQGYAYLLNNTLNSALSSAGAIAANTTSANNSITALQKKAVTLQTQLAATQARYTAQYAALDVTLTKMSQTSTYLTQQLAALTATR